VTDILPKNISPVGDKRQTESIDQLWGTDKLQ